MGDHTRKSSAKAINNANGREDSPVGPSKCLDIVFINGDITSMVFSHVLMSFRGAWREGTTNQARQLIVAVLQWNSGGTMSQKKATRVTISVFETIKGAPFINLALVVQSNYIIGLGEAMHCSL